MEGKNHTVSGSAESTSSGVGALCVGALSPDCGDDGRIREILVVGFGGVGIVAAGPNVVDVEIGFFGQRPLDASVADVVGVYTIRIGIRAAASLQGREALVVQDVEISLACRGVD